VNEFAEQCRSEWKRLRVPDSIANEMAAELSADLAEARTDGVSLEEVVGGAGSDPRSFAAMWAAERGVLPSRSRNKGARGAVVTAAVAALAAVAVSGAVLMIVAPDSTSDTQHAVARAESQAATAAWVSARTGGSVTIAPPPQWVSDGSGNSAADTWTVGLVLLIVGLVGIVPLAAFVLLRRSGLGTRFA
jgi:hypothetical protein